MYHAHNSHSFKPHNVLKPPLCTPSTHTLQSLNHHSLTPQFSQNTRGFWCIYKTKPEIPGFKQFAKLPQLLIQNETDISCRKLNTFLSLYKQYIFNYIGDSLQFISFFLQVYYTNKSNLFTI